MLERLPIALADFPGVTSVVVAQHGDTVAEWYAEGDDGRTVLRNTRSATKTVTGMLVGIAVDDGSIDVEASVVSYLGERPSIQAPVAAAGVTVAELLTMSSCLDCDDSDDESPGNEERMYPAEDWLAFASSIPLRSPCGPPRFRYCTAHTVLLGAAVEAATGTELSQYASARLFGPLGIQGERWFRSSAGVAFPGEGSSCAARTCSRSESSSATAEPLGADGSCRQRGSINPRCRTPPSTPTPTTATCSGCAGTRRDPVRFPVG